ncbi:uncharacterized protein LOC143291312 [Babylonia areolata]|uniref:uncharacterized protein LOC143291312 n=1 Tax=Babylonia areolata TaxID=304850 RepID=UPI003FD1A914
MMFRHWVPVLLALCVGRGQGQLDSCRQTVYGTCDQQSLRHSDILQPDDFFCRAVDVMLGCAVDVMDTGCDVMEAAYLVETEIKPRIIDRFLTACGALGNASLPMYTDQCQPTLSVCMTELLLAEPPSSSTPTPPAGTSPATQVDPLAACLQHMQFQECTDRRQLFGVCPGGVISAVIARKQSEQQRFSRLFQCQQRGGEVVLKQCVDSLLEARNHLDRDQLCRQYQETQRCVRHAKTLGSLDLPPAAFDEHLASVSQFALQEPLFCQAANPCLEAVKVCNATALPPEHPCQLAEVYSDCLTQALRQCDPNYEAVTIQQVEQDIDSIRQQHSCEDRTPAPPGPQGAGSCDQVFSTCGQPFRDVMAQSDVGHDQRCQAVDALLTCALKNSAVCNIVSAADLKVALRDVVTTFTTSSDTPCKLERAGDPDLQMTGCDLAITSCNALLATDDPSTFEPAVMCSAFRAFRQCTEKELTPCDPQAVTEVTGHVLITAARYTAAPFLCDIRDQLGSLGADEYFAVCQNDFYTVMSSSASQQLACTALQTFRQCVTQAKASASVVKQSEFDSALFQQTQFLFQPPYSCSSGPPTKIETVTPTPVVPPVPETPTPKPVETPTPKPVETPTPTPKPVETPTPKPVETPTPKPVETPTPTPKPVETPTPTPKPVETPTPTPKPVGTPTPKPVGTPTPKPVETPTPKPVGTPTPKPVGTPTPKPVETPTPKPVGTPTPTPVETPTPKPVGTPTPTPVENPPVETPTPKPVGNPPVENPTPKPVGNPPVENPTPKPAGIPTPGPSTPLPTAPGPSADVGDLRRTTDSGCGAVDSQLWLILLLVSVLAGTMNLA